MYNSQDIYNALNSELKNKKINVSKMLTSCNLGKNTIFHLKNGSMIAADSLAKIADYLKCSVDYLLGRESEVKSVDDVNAEFMSLFNQLTEIDKGKFLAKMEMVIENYSPDQKENVS